jgi:hypothetical protein
VIGSHIEQPSPVIIKRSVKPNSPLGGSTVGRFEDVLDRATIMTIMASQLANRMESIKLSDGQYTQSRKEALRELYRVHFPGCAEEVTLKGQGQTNPRAFAAQREEWELSKKVINQSKIRWVISTFKPFISAGTDGIVPARLRQGAEYLVTHLCRNS